MHEAQMWKQNSFVNLTYSPEHLPDDLSLDLKHVQDFLKRLRKKLSPQKIRFFGCGEYGDENKRPHYHLAIFNYWPRDARYYCTTPNGDRLFSSDELTQTWGKGLVLTGAVTYESARYIAGYVVKKKTGKLADEANMRLSPDGHVYTVKPEFSHGSRRPGLGDTWFKKYKTDAFPSDFVTTPDGKKVPVPRYYTDKLSDEDPNHPKHVLRVKSEKASIKFARKIRAHKHRSDNTPERLATRLEVAKARVSLKSRKL